MTVHAKSEWKVFSERMALYVNLLYNTKWINGWRNNDNETI